MTAAVETLLEPWRSPLLESLPGITHAVTRRVTGMGRADGNVGFSAPRDRDDAWAMRQRWCDAAGLSAERLVTLGQVHGSIVQLVSASDAGRGARPGSDQIGLGDALATNAPGPILLTLHADCQPILMVDPARRGHPPAVAVIHAGWRGAVADIVGATLATMRSAFGTRPADLHVSLGPAIGACCYEVGDEVTTAWRGIAGADAMAALVRGAGSYHFSLTAANTLLLRRGGVSTQHIEMAPVCTRCDGQNWFSHRGQGPHTGRFGAMIAIDNGGMAP